MKINKGVNWEIHGKWRQMLNFKAKNIDLLKDLNLQFDVGHCGLMTQKWWLIL